MDPWTHWKNGSSDLGEHRWRTKHFGSTPAGDVAEPRPLASCAKGEAGDCSARSRSWTDTAALGECPAQSRTAALTHFAFQLGESPRLCLCSLGRLQGLQSPLTGKTQEPGKLVCGLDPPTFASYGPPGVLERRSLVG